MFKGGKNLKLFLVTAFFLVASFFAGSFALAQTSIPASLGGTFGLGTQDLYGTAIKIVNVFLGFLGVISISVIAYGGFIWMTSGGSFEKVNKAKKILISAVIGLAIILLSFTIIQFIVSSMNSGGGGGGPTCDAGNVGFCNVCNRCTDLGGPGPYIWSPDATCNIALCTGFPTVFEVTAIVPIDDICADGIDATYPMNSVIRVYFTKSVLNTPVNINTGIIIQSTGSNSQCLGDPLALVPYDFTVNGNMVEIRPQIGSCPANPCGADRCFDDQSTIDVDVLIGSLQATDGTILSNSLAVDENIQFFTNSTVDCADPTVALLSSSQICLGTANNMGSSATDDGGVAQVEFFDDNGSSAFITPTIIPCVGIPALCGQDTFPPWVNPIGSIVWNPTGPLYIAGDSYKVTVRASDLDTNEAIHSRTFTLREAHCCNGVQDVDEVGDDCGGADCAACNGGACGNDLATDCGGPADCSINNDICASNICNCAADIPTPDPLDDPLLTICEVAGYDATVGDCCICEGPPLIDCVTPSDPAGDPSGCLDPVGTTGTLITLWGRNFGTYVPGLSTVTISGVNADLAETINSSCTNSWTNNQIIVVVPPGILGPGEIIVTNASGHSDSTADLQGIAINDFIDDGADRPSLCMVENIEPGSSCFANSCGHFQETVRGGGIGISPGDEIEFGDSTNNFVGLFTNPMPDILIETQVPNMIPGSVGFRALSLAGVYSNYLKFKVTTSPGGPQIDYIEPSFGPEGQYITIYGSNLGNSGTGVLTFTDPVSGAVELGDFTFPAECGPGSYWTSKYIVVKVPNFTPDVIGSVDVMVEVGGTPSNIVPFNICALNATTCPLLPGMCKIQPTMGPWNTLVDIWGENFGAAQGNVEFYDGIPAFPNTASQSIGSWTDVGAPIGAEILDVEVPDSLDPGGAAESGPVHVIDSITNRSSNSLPFVVGTCTVDADCPDPSTEFCCAGSCYTGGCPIPNYSTYTWSFTTGDYFVEEKCDPLSPPASPTPWSKRGGGQDACINAAILARFTEDVLAATVTLGTTVLIEECTFENAQGNCTAWGASFIAPNNGSWTLIDDDALTPLTINGFRFDPDLDGVGAPVQLLTQNTWYKVTLIGGQGNITASTDATPLVDDYIWEFKTRDSAELCSVDSVNVLPNPSKLVQVNATQTFIASPKTNEDPCLELNNLIYDYTWNSTDATVASIPGSITAIETATAGMSGQTKIQATLWPDDITGEADLTVDFEGLVVTSHWYECGEVCVNTSLGARFDREVDDVTLTTGANNNVNIYLCNDGQACNNYLLPGPIGLNNVQASYIWDVVSGNSEATFIPIADLNIDEYYRVVLKGGPNGIISALGSPLMSLNENLAYGEECDPGVTPVGCNFGTCLWSGSSCGLNHEECSNSDPSSLLDGCDNDCYNSGPVITSCGLGAVDGSDAIRENCDYMGMCRDIGTGDIIGDGTTATPHEFCRTDGDCVTTLGDTCDIPDNDGCNNLCLLTGSTHTAICGDSKLEWGEACDDGNQTNGDGCNSSCLREGRKAEGDPAYTLTCGDGAPQTYPDGAGEDCDDGNNISGDGCSADCLSEGAPGSICGDGSIGIGEDCDGQKGCDPVSCLWMGSGGEAQCGNNVIDGPDNDSFSWIFKTKSLSDDSCDTVNVEIVPDATTMVINEIKGFKAVVRTAADECDSKGQTLNSWNYDWTWWSGNVAVVNIFSTCGNNQIDIGEDCDFGGECSDATPCTTGGAICSNGSVCQPAPLSGCTFNCLNDGGSASCGDGALWLGEDCDDGGVLPGDGCSATCLREGFPSEGVTGFTCGDGVLEQDPTTGAGEDCDDGNFINNDGCDINCLNEGAGNNYPNQKVIGIGVGNTIINAQTGAFTGTASVTVNEAVGPVPCQISGADCCNEGVTSCGTFYDCIPEDSPPGFCELDGTGVESCYCCCDPNAGFDTCTNINPDLQCLANQAPCTGGGRGQCCGCEDNSDCAFMPQTPFCGNTTCCFAAPLVNSIDPVGGATDICRNVLVTATFDQEMDAKTFSRNFEFAKRYDVLTTPVCPAGEPVSAFVPAGGGYIYCVVSGQVSSREDVIGTTLEFSSKDVLDPPPARYYATIYGNDSNFNTMTCGNRRVDIGEDCDDGNNIIGDGCGIDCLNEGTSACVLPDDPNCCGNDSVDIGEDCDGTANCNGDCTNAGTTFQEGCNSDPDINEGEDCDDGNFTAGDGCAPNCTNEGTVLMGVRSIYDIPLQATYQWFFETGPDICRINDINITSIVGNGDYGRINHDNVRSDLFICSGMDDGANPDNVCYRDALRPSVTAPIPPDNPNMPGNQHVYQARPIDQSGNQLNFGLFDWYWNENDSDDIFILNSTSPPFTDSATDPLILENVNIGATSNPTSGQGYINVSATDADPNDSLLVGSMTKRFNIRVFLCNNPWPDIDWWPWEDDTIMNAAADCDNPMDGCEDSFFELFYCRDYGDPGPEDDLPKISSNPMVFGESGDIFKEFLFIQDESGSGGPLILSAFADPCRGPGGQLFNIEARVTDMDSIPAGGVVAHIQSTADPLVDIDTIVLSDAAVGVVGDHLYGATWDSSGAGCAISDDCSYYIDIWADDTLANQTILDNISCIN